ncbi:regulator [Bordetella sp. H567]|uniref:type II toxin-antitoxin system PrlF family antitoxin n=1 Tax=Bordetella sp. H567 TaxID=1697043 RepID=UPI00081D0907|nr:type II toxin-antitoxin system PrlF family antitoxin [Bordetella sp. H567]AOB29713.1 regulator [Bordetella sp. H567]
MPATLDVESTLTERYQTTVPETVRRALGLKKRDKIHYSIRDNGEVVLTRAEDADEADPALEAFLTFLAHDIASHPERLVPLSNDLLASMKKAAREAGDIDLDAPLSANDE